MYLCISLFFYIKCRISIISQAIMLRLFSSAKKDLIIIAQASQLALYESQVLSGKRPKPRPTPMFRLTSIFVSKHLEDWKEWINNVNPETIVKWHRLKFTDFWAKNSKRIGRPPIDNNVIKLVHKIYSENYNISPEKIHERLVLMGLKHVPAPNTIVKYIKDIKNPPTKKQIENWMTFIKNHMDVTWATDFFTIPTLRFEVLYVLIVIEHGSRRIVHFAVTKNPNMFWLTQQFRNATPYGSHPKYLIHDNDPVFRSKVFQGFLANSNIKSKPTSFRSPWQNPYAERVNGIIRQELLNHIIPFNEKHLEKLLGEYVHDYYNTNRTHQGINCNTPIRKPIYVPADAKDIKLKATPVLNGLYHIYTRVS